FIHAFFDNILYIVFNWRIGQIVPAPSPLDPHENGIIKPPVSHHSIFSLSRPDENPVFLRQFMKKQKIYGISDQFFLNTSFSHLFHTCRILTKYQNTQNKTIQGVLIFQVILSFVRIFPLMAVLSVEFCRLYG
ncbi:MAG: hypothetical protein J6A23_15260, partial [Thermoguttaceae bacterium]|nr:hypothetical protein [Thermoguttaceae bacterium]